MNPKTSPVVHALGFALTIGALLLGNAALAQRPRGATSPEVAPVAAAPKTQLAGTVTQWEDLVPKDWDPMGGLKLKGAGILRDGDAKAMAMLDKLREVWDNAPVRNDLDGQPVKLPGYLVPLESSKGEVSELLLVPYFGACIHTPPPPANQIVHVKLAKPAKLATMDVITVSGTLHAGRSDSPMGVSGYRVEDATVEKYKAPLK
jgi:hypothetical protein